MVGRAAAAEFFNHRKGRVPMKTNKLIPLILTAALALSACASAADSATTAAPAETAAATPEPTAGT